MLSCICTLIDDQWTKWSKEHFGKLTATVDLEKCVIFSEKTGVKATKIASTVKYAGLQFWYDFQLTGEVLHGCTCIAIIQPALYPSRAWFSHWCTLSYILTVTYTVYFTILLKYMQQLIVHTRLVISVMRIMLIWGGLQNPSVFGSLHPTLPHVLFLEVIHTGYWPQVVEHILGNNVTVGATRFLNSPHLRKRLTLRSANSRRSHLPSAQVLPKVLRWAAIHLRHLFLYSLPFLRLFAWGRHRQRWVNYCIFNKTTTNKRV